MDQITLNINPVPKPRMTKADSWKKRPIVLKYWKYKDYLVEQANKKGFVLGERFRVEFHIEMPKSWSKKKKNEMIRNPHKQKPDIDNMLKGLMDSLLKEDSHVYYVVALKKWSDKGSIKVENFPECLDI